MVMQIAYIVYHQYTGWLRLPHAQNSEVQNCSDIFYHSLVIICFMKMRLSMNVK